ncbi:Retrovirus-related Pol polyprotein from transposon TNT 1-94 [Sesbania bispinosa]|nr:Retrovirus-related Pol polyprotein from transposon TNT 1-94 [Sesbania bispinosa]
MAESSNSRYVQPAIPKFDVHCDHWAKLMENFLRSKEYWNLVENGISVVVDGAASSKAELKLMEEQKLKDLKIKIIFIKWKFQGSTRAKRTHLQALRRDFEVLRMKEGEMKNVNNAEVEDEVEEEDKLLLMAYLKQGKKEDEWFLDSGCNNHMSRNGEWFLKMDESSRHTVKLGNNSRMVVMGKGNVHLNVNGVTHVVSNV